MKKMKIIFQRMFPRPVRQETVFTEALSEAFVDFFKEMGYKINSKK